MVMKNQVSRYTHVYIYTLHEQNNTNTVNMQLNLCSLLLLFHYSHEFLSSSLSLSRIIATKQQFSNRLVSSSSRIFPPVSMPYVIILSRIVSSDKKKRIIFYPSRAMLSPQHECTYELNIRL